MLFNLRIDTNVKRHFSTTLSALFSRFNDDNGIDGNSANSRDALLDESKSGAKRRYSNTSQSSHEFSDGEKSKEKRHDKSKNTEDPLNSGSMVEIDWLFEGGDCSVEPWTSKSKFRVTGKRSFLGKGKTETSLVKFYVSLCHASLYCYVFLIRAASILDFRSL